MRITDRAVEELSELQKELTKILRGKGDKEHLAEEMADARIMLSQLRFIFNNFEAVTERSSGKRLQS